MSIEELKAVMGQTCNCIRTDCWHPKGRCEEPPRQRYGQCSTCQHFNEKKCPTCGQPMPKEKE